MPETLIDNVKLNFFLTFLFCGIITHIPYSFFDNISPTVCEKNGHPLLGLSSKVFTFDHLFGHRSDFFNNLTIFFTKWPEDHKNRCLSSSTNSVGLHFHEGVEKIKENGTNTKNRKPTNWAGKVWWENSSVFVQLGQKLKKTII